MLLVERPINLAERRQDASNDGLLRRAGRSVVTVQARLLRYRYPIVGGFKAGRRARMCAACGLA